MYMYFGLNNIAVRLNNPLPYTAGRKTRVEYKKNQKKMYDDISNK